MKLVGTMTVRNEQWVLNLSLRAALLVSDELVVMDHGSTDGTPEILAQVAREHPGRLHVLHEPDPQWREAAIRQRLLEAARERGATHVWVLDGDEVLAGHLLPAIRGELAALKEGEALKVPVLDLWRGLDRYRDDERFELNHVFLGFRDSPEVSFAPAPDGYDLHRRFPVGVERARAFPAARSEGGVLHLAFVHWRRILTRSAWYKMLERLRFPWRATPEQINQKYDLDLDEGALRTAPVDPLWWQPYLPWLGSVDTASPSWFEDACRGLWREHGSGAFAGLDFWDLPRSWEGDVEVPELASCR